MTFVNRQLLERLHKINKIVTGKYGSTVSVVDVICDNIKMYKGKQFNVLLVGL